MPNRPDGRTSGGTLRPLSCEMSCLQRADGSALWKAGSTHVLAAVYGPVAPRQSSREQSDSLVTVLCKSGSTTTGSSGGGGTTSSTFEREWESFLAEMLMACVDIAHYPRTVIQVVLQIIQADGSVLSCALHAAVAALMDAGILMKCMPVATTCLLGSDNDSLSSSLPLKLDPVMEEEQNEESSIVVFVNDSAHPDKVLGCQTTMGTGIALEALLTCVQAASRASPAVIAFWRLAVEQKVTRESQTLWTT